MNFTITTFLTPPSEKGLIYSYIYKAGLASRSYGLIVSLAGIYTDNYTDFTTGVIYFTSNAGFGIVPSPVNDNITSLFKRNSSNLSINFSISQNFDYYSDFLSAFNSFSLTTNKFYYFKSCS